MNFFAEQRHRSDGPTGFLVPRLLVFKSVNPGVLIVASPLFFAALWTALGRRRPRAEARPTKMAAALVLLGVGFPVHGGGRTAR